MDHEASPEVEPPVYEAPAAEDLDVPDAPSVTAAGLTAPPA
jgi:hypothetical protein